MKKEFSSTKPCFCLVLRESESLKLAPISIFLFYIIIYTIFTIYDTFHSILFLNDARDITNFTTYVLQIGMSPITKNNSNIYSLYFLSNTNHIFTPSICKVFSSYEFVIFVYLF